MSEQVFSRRIGDYGDPEMILLHGSLREKYETESTACAHIRNPNAPRFIPAPARSHRRVVPMSMRPDVAWCTGCRDWHPRECFHKDATRPSGLQSYCISYRATRRKLPARLRG